MYLIIIIYNDSVIIVVCFISATDNSHECYIHSFKKRENLLNIEILLYTYSSQKNV